MAFIVRLSFAVSFDDSIVVSFPEVMVRFDPEFMCELMLVISSALLDPLSLARSSISFSMVSGFTGIILLFRCAI